MHADRYIKKMNSPPHASNRCDKVQVCFRLLGGVASKTIMQKDPNRRGPTPKVSCAGYSLLRCMYLSSKIILSTYLGASTNRVTLALQELSDALEIEATCLLSMLRETVTEMDSLKVCAHCHKPAWVYVKLYISKHMVLAGRRAVSAPYDAALSESNRYFQAEASSLKLDDRSYRSGMHAVSQQNALLMLLANMLSRTLLPA